MRSASRSPEVSVAASRESEIVSTAIPSGLKVRAASIRPPGISRLSGAQRTESRVSPTLAYSLRSLSGERHRAGQQVRETVHRVDMRGGRAGETPQLHHRSDQRLELRRAPRLDILQHRSLVLAHSLGAGDTLVQADAKHDAEFVRDGLRLGHHRRRQRARGWKLANIGQRGSGQRADGIEGEIAPEFEPDLGANVFEHRRLESGAREALRNPSHALAARAVELSDREAITLDMLHHPGGDELGGWIHHAADDSRGGDHPRDDAARIHAAHHAGGQFTAMVMEIPVGDAVLHGHDDRVGAEQLRYIAGDGLELMGLYGEDHQLLGARGGAALRSHDVARQVFTAIAEDEPDAAPAHRLQIRAAHDEGDLLTRRRQLRAHVTADGAATDDGDLHRAPLCFRRPGAPACAGERLIDQVGAATRAAAGSLVTRPGTALRASSGPWRRVPDCAETPFRRPAADAPGCAPRRRRRHPGQARRSRDDGMSGHPIAMAVRVRRTRGCTPRVPRRAGRSSRRRLQDSLAAAVSEENLKLSIDTISFSEYLEDGMLAA